MYPWAGIGDCSRRRGGRSWRCSGGEATAFATTRSAVRRIQRQRSWRASLCRKEGLQVLSRSHFGHGWRSSCGLHGIGIGPGDEVIVPAYTWIASASAVVAGGGIPVIAEVDETLLMDP